MVLPCCAGLFEGRVDYQVNRALAHSAAGQRRQKFTNKGADGLFGLIISDFFADFELRTNTSQHLVSFIYTLLNAFAKDLMLILLFT